MNQDTVNLFLVIGNALWIALMSWGIFKSIRKGNHTEVAYFIGEVQTALVEAKNYAIHHGFDIAHVSIAHNHNLNFPKQFTLVVTYKTKQ